MITYKFSVLVLILCCVCSCSTAGPTNVVLSSPQSPLETNTVTPTLARKTSTPKPSATPDSTGTVYAQDNATAHVAEKTLVADYSSPCETIYAPRVFSPNRDWLVDLCYSTEDTDLILAFSSKENNTKWEFLFKDFIPQTLESPDGGMSVVHWSNDGRYAYFRSYIGGDGGECFRSVDADGVGLFRVDLQNGNLTTLLPVRDSGWYSFTFSPTDRRLVYGNLGREFQILDLNTGALLDVQSQLPFSHADAYLWSPDGLELVYSTVLYNETGNTAEYALRWLNVDSGEEQILLRSEQKCLKVQSWRDDNVLIVESFDQDRNLTVIEYDLTTKQVHSENTATPFP